MPAAARERYPDPQRRTTRSRRAPSPPPAPRPRERPASSADTSTHYPLGDDNFHEILLRLTSSASLTRAVVTNSDLCRIASRPGFLDRFRELHPSSPFMGIFSSDDGPLFQRSNVPDRDIAAVTRKGDFLLTRLDDAPRWRLRDCRNGVLLLSRDDNSLCVYNPLSGGQPVRIQPCPDHVTMEGEFLADCLLNGTVQQCLAVDCFRVVAVQQQQRGRQIRAVEYDSSTLEWRCHPWATPWVDGKTRLPKWGVVPMYAASRIFWKYDAALVLVLDTRTMEFKSCPLPAELASQWFYSIGEIEDGKAYLVCIQRLQVGENQIHRLQVWALHDEYDDDNVLKLQRKEEVPMSQLLSKPYSTRVSRVCTVVNGLAVLTCHRGPQFVVDLQKKSQLGNFKISGWVYPYQMSWPPAINCGSAPPMEDNGIDLDDGSARIQPLEMDPGHDELTLQMAGVFPSASCDRVNLEDQSETNNLPMNTTNDTEMLEQQNSHKAHLEVSCADKVNVNDTLRKNTISGRKVFVESHCCNLALHNKSSEDNGIDLDDGRAKIQPVETDPGHDELTSQMSGVFPSASCDGVNLEDKSETNNLPMNTTENTEMLEQQNSHTAHLEVSCADKVNEALYVKSTLRKNTISGGKDFVESHCCNLALHNKSSEARKNLSAFSGTKQFAKHHDEQSTSKRQMAANMEDHFNGCNTYKGQVNHQSEAHDPTDEEPYGQRNKQKTNATSIVISSNNYKTMLGHLDQHIPSPSSRNPRVVESESSSTTAAPQSKQRVPCGNISVGQKATTQHARTNNEKSSLHVEDVTGSYKCNFKGCRDTFSARSSVDRHFMEVHGQGKYSKCTSCDKKFRRKEHLNSHLEKIHKSRVTCRFEGCTEEFSGKHAREIHEKSTLHVEYGTEKNKCHIRGCSSTFSTRDGHNKHYKMFHMKTSASHGQSGRPIKEKT